MGSTAQVLGLPAPYESDSTSIFSRNMANNSDFMKAFGNGSTNTRAVEPAQTEKSGNRPSSLGYTLNEQSFFDFDRVSDGNSPFPSQTPKEWNFGFQDMSNPSPLHIFTDNQPSVSAKAHYGQVTPPGDEHDGDSLLEEHLRQQQGGLNETTSAKKRKRGNSTTSKSSTQTSSKRSRKNNNRRSASSNNAATSEPEDIRRSKFLERSRIAASKCRQKKKEGIQNLEDRSHQLQIDNNSIRMMIDSLRQEVLFFKGEILRHGECESHHIQDFMKSCANEFGRLLIEITN